MAGLDQPPDEVSPPDASRSPRCPAAGEDNIASGVVQLLGDLATRLCAADHEHAAGRKGSLVAVSLRVDLEEIGRQRVGARGTMRTLVGARGEDDGAGTELSAGRLEGETVAHRLDRVDRHVLTHGSPGGIPLEVGDDLVPRHEPVRVISFVVTVR